MTRYCRGGYQPPVIPDFRKHPDERIRPYSLGGEAAAIQRTALSRQVSGGFYPPLQLVGAKRFLNGNEPGWFGNQRMGTDPVRHKNIGENLWKNVYLPAGSGG